MLTVEKLKLFGADTQAGLGRCINNETFYLRLVNMSLADKNFDALEAAVNAGDNKAAFEAAHALKGSLGNLALTPILRPVEELTELLRHADGPVDGQELLGRILQAKNELVKLSQD